MYDLLKVSRIITWWYFSVIYVSMQDIWSFKLIPDLISDHLCFVFFLPPTGDKVHCYCNSPRCVGYSYMCVSEYGCFSQVTTDSSYSRGCVEDLVMIERCLQAEEETFKRLNKSLIKADQTLDIGVQLLSCCYDDMCNYANYEQEEQRSTINGNRGKFSNINMIVLTLYFNNWYAVVLWEDVMNCTIYECHLSCY